MINFKEVFKMQNKNKFKIKINFNQHIYLKQDKLLSEKEIIPLEEPKLIEIIHLLRQELKKIKINLYFLLKE